MLPVYVVLCNVTTLQHTMGLIGIVMACYGQKSKFDDVFKVFNNNMSCFCSSVSLLTLISQ